MLFPINVAGQNKKVRRKYWNIFNGSTWDKYHLAESIDDSLSIIDKVIEDAPDFMNKKNLTERIDKEAFKFINDFVEILE